MSATVTISQIVTSARLLYQLTPHPPPPGTRLRKIQRCIVMQISLLVCIYIYIYIPNRDIMKKSVWPRNTYDIPQHPPPGTRLRKIQRHIVMHISFLVCNIDIYIEIDTKDRYEKSQFYHWTHMIYPPKGHCS